MKICPICEFIYCETDTMETKGHEKYCAHYAYATARPGYLHYKKDEQVKMFNDGQSILRNDKRPFAQYYAFHLIARSRFSHSYYQNDFSGDHPDFQTFAAMMLNQPSIQKRFRNCPEVLEELIRQYGKREGLKNGYEVFITPSMKRKKKTYIIFE